MNCPDLKKLARGKWRVVRNQELVAGGKAGKWDWVIPCSHGHICPWGPGLLAACLDGHKVIANDMVMRKGYTRVQFGDDGSNITFPEGDLVWAARRMRAFKKRVMTAEQREVAVARLDKARLTKETSR